MAAARRRRATAGFAAGLAAALLALGTAPAQAERIKDIATVAGVRTNQLVGYGLVVGLDGTGDQTTPGAVHGAEHQEHAGSASA